MCIARTTGRCVTHGKCLNTAEIADRPGVCWIARTMPCLVLLPILQIRKDHRGIANRN